MPKGGNRSLAVRFRDAPQARLIPTRMIQMGKDPSDHCFASPDLRLVLDRGIQPARPAKLPRVATDLNMLAVLIGGRTDRRPGGYPPRTTRPAGQTRRSRRGIKRAPRNGPSRSRGHVQIAGLLSASVPPRCLVADQPVDRRRSGARGLGRLGTLLQGDARSDQGITEG